MPSEANEPTLIATPVDLPTLSVNFPPRSDHELLRNNVVNTLQDLVKGTVYAASVEGPVEMGKTTVLSQFARRFSSSAISVFISSSNRFSFDVEMIRKDITTQVYWALNSQILQSDKYNPLLLKSYYSDLQGHAKRSKSIFYFIVDGIDELDRDERERLLQQMADILPVGIPQFRFLFSGDSSLYKPMLGRDLAIKSYPLTEFSFEEAKALFDGHDLASEIVNDINGQCRGIPGRLASVRRALDTGVQAQAVVRDAQTTWPTFFEVDWKQVDQSNEQLLKILALLVHDLKPYTFSEIANILNISEKVVANSLNTVNFLKIDSASGLVHFANTGLTKHIADRLKDRKPQIQKLLIKRLLASPHSSEALLELPTRLEESSQHLDLVNLLTPDHLLQVLERTQTLSRVDDTVQRGFRSAKKLDRDADVLRFGLQQSIVAEIAAANTWESEIAALAALRHDKEALALANSAMLREDRLLMLTTLAHGVWLRGDPVQPELLDSIKLLIENLDYWSLGRRARNIASKLTCVSPDLATTVLTKAKWATDETSLDQTFVSLAVSALRDIKDDRRRDQAMEIAARSRRDPSAKGLLDGIRVLSGRANPDDVRARAKRIANIDTRLSLLRYWCVLNASQAGADEVAQEAIRLALSTPSVRADATLLADLSKAVSGGPTIERKSELIAMLDGLRGTAERLGPSVDYVRLQLSLALAETEIDMVASEGRLRETFDYIARIGDMPSRGEAYATFLGALKRIPPLTVQPGDSLAHSCASELDAVVITLSDATADHYQSLGAVITGLAQGDIERALEYTKIVNTEHRRNAVLLDVIDAVLHRPISAVDPAELEKVLDSITSSDERDRGLLHIMQRFADGKISAQRLIALQSLIARIDRVADSVVACHAFVCAVKILTQAESNEHMSLKEELVRKLMSRWEHIDVEWMRIGIGFDIVRDLAAIDADWAEVLLRSTDEIKADSGISAPKPAATFVACIRLVVRAFCGLLHNRLENETDLHALSALIDIIPAYGERAILWADLCMRATILGRADLAEQLIQDYCLPAFGHVPLEDAAYRVGVLIQLAPAVYRVQPATCIDALTKLDYEDRDIALLDIIRFILFDRVPSDPTDKNARPMVKITYEKLLQVEELTRRLETDWMIYSTAQDIADLLQSPANRSSLTVPQRQDVARRFNTIAKEKLPITTQISHPGFRIATMAQIMRLTQSKPADWIDLIDEAKALTNVADRVYVLQIIALSLPNGMSSQSVKLLEQAKQQIKDIPCTLDQIERYLGLAEDVQQSDSALCRDLVNRAATTIKTSTDNVEEHQRRLVDLAYRVDAELAKRLIDEFDGDDAKRRAQAQMRLLEIRNSIRDDEGAIDEKKVLRRIQSGDTSRLGMLLLRSLNAGRVQSYPPHEIRDYLDLAAEQPLRRAYPLLAWYLENAVTRFAKTPHASTFLRPIFNACVVGAQMAGQVAGRAMVRLKAVKAQASQLNGTTSLLATPINRESAVRMLTAWLEQNLSETVLIHDPYFGPGDLHWVQMIRSAKSRCEITIMTARRNQPTPSNGEELEDVYAAAWRRAYDQHPPKTEIAVIGGENSKDSPIHDRWLVSGASGLRFGTSLNSLGLTKDSEISEMTTEDVERRRDDMLQYLKRERSEHKGEKLRLIRFWL